jgi:hypothetical protein
MYTNRSMQQGGENLQYFGHSLVFCLSGKYEHSGCPLECLYESIRTLKTIPVRPWKINTTFKIVFATIAQTFRAVRTVL